jgi:hypothetical protein
MDDDWQVCIKDQEKYVKVNKRIVKKSPKCRVSEKIVKSERFSFQKETISSKLRKLDNFSGFKLESQKKTKKSSKKPQVSSVVGKFSKNLEKSSGNFKQSKQIERKNFSPVKISDCCEGVLRKKRNSEKISGYLKREVSCNSSRLFFPVNQKPLQSERQESPYDPKQQRKKIFEDSFEFSDSQSPVKLSITPSLLTEGEVTQRARPQTVDLKPVINYFDQKEIIEISMFNIPEEFSNNVIQELLKSFSIYSVSLDGKNRNSGVLKTFVRKDVEGIIIKLRNLLKKEAISQIFLQKTLKL